MSSAAVATLRQQFSQGHLVHLARDFAFPCVPSMVRTWGYKRTYHMATSLVAALLSHKKAARA